MSERQTKRRAGAALDTGGDRSTTIVPASSRRMIPVGDAKTIVVQPRLAPQYKAMIWFSFVLNGVLLAALLIGGIMALSWYSTVKANLARVQAALDMQSPLGQQIQSLTGDPLTTLASDPTPLMDTTRGKVDELMTSIEGLEGAHIRTSIPIDRQLPISLEVPVNQQTTVRTTAPVPMQAPATFTLPGGGGQINGSVTLSLPQGLELPVNLNMTIPISSSVPVQFDVPVDIAMQDTELADDFARLHTLVEPAAELVKAR